MNLSEIAKFKWEEVTRKAKNFQNIQFRNVHDRPYAFATDGFIALLVPFDGVDREFAVKAADFKALRSDREVRLNVDENRLEGQTGNVIHLAPLQDLDHRFTIEALLIGLQVDGEPFTCRRTDLLALLESLTGEFVTLRPVTNDLSRSREDLGKRRFVTVTNDSGATGFVSNNFPDSNKHLFSSIHPEVES